MSGPGKNDAKTACPECGAELTIARIEPLPAEPDMMQHTFMGRDCGHIATFKFPKAKG